MPLDKIRPAPGSFLDSPSAVWADFNYFCPLSVHAVAQPPLPPPVRARENRNVDNNGATPLVTGRQLQCLRTLFQVYAHRVFLAEEERDGVPVPSRMALSLSRDGWARFCREILRGGVSGLPMIPYVRMLPLYDDHAARLCSVTPRPEFRGATLTLTARLTLPVFGWDAFVGLLEDVADRWYATLGSAKLRVKRSPWVSAAAVRGGTESPLSAMCDEIACSSFHDPSSEQMLTKRQATPATGGAPESRRSICPRHLALQDLLIRLGAEV
jgi:hypothetical protein